MATYRAIALTNGLYHTKGTISIKINDKTKDSTTKSVCSGSKEYYALYEFDTIPKKIEGVLDLETYCSGSGNYFTCQLIKLPSTVLLSQSNTDVKVGRQTLVILPHFADSRPVYLEQLYKLDYQAPSNKMLTKSSRLN